MSVSQRDGSFVITVEHVSDLFKEEKGKRKSIAASVFSFTYRWGLAPAIGFLSNKKLIRGRRGSSRGRSRWPH
jgi:hypothetical protein